jgi:hypothetical protein
LPAYLLTHQQIQTALEMAGFELAPGSPLAILPQSPRLLEPSDTAFQKMADGHLLEVQDGKWRVNTLAKAVLLVCACPEEVITLRATGGEGQGFTICRRGPLVSECTVGGPALVKLSFPLTRSAVMLTLVSALSSERPEPPSTGFRFRGRVEDAFVLSTVLNETRSGAGGPPVERLAGIVAAAIEKPICTLPFVLVAGAEPLLGLARSPDAVDAAVGRLAIAGHVRNEGGRLVPSEPAERALAGAPNAGFAISRTLVGPQGPASQTLQVVRSGERSIVFRLLHHEGASPMFEWLEVNKLQLRALVSAALMDEKELKLAAVEPLPGRFCPNCGARTREGQRFCRSCGQNLEEGGAA